MSFGTVYDFDPRTGNMVERKKAPSASTASSSSSAAATIPPAPKKANVALIDQAN